MACGHVFHSPCAVDWILKGTSDGCAECRFPFFPEPEKVDEVRAFFEMCKAKGIENIDEYLDLYMNIEE
jgi:hypothetical protein